jgi:hypothetical protein
LAHAISSEPVQFIRKLCLLQQRIPSRFGLERPQISSDDIQCDDLARIIDQKAGGLLPQAIALLGAHARKVEQILAQKYAGIHRTERPNQSLSTWKVDADPKETLDLKTLTCS